MERIISQIFDVTDKIKEKKRADKEIATIDALYDSREQFFDSARNFLMRLGEFDLFSGSVNTNRLLLLDDKDTHLTTWMKTLDKNLLRKSFKIGVLYVDKGQNDQRSILCNNKGSLMYEQLLSNLGKRITEDEAFNLLNVQANILYYATVAYDIIFHVATLIPTNVNDPQQINKKRYIGNDSVHIIWSDNNREYKPGTIKSSFNFVHIIIYPIHNGLCRIKIKKKTEGDRKKERNEPVVKFFGPLISGMILPIQMLPPLLRYSAINARKNITQKNLRIVNPIGERKDTLKKLIDKYAIPFKSKAEQESLLLTKLLNFK